MSKIDPQKDRAKHIVLAIIGAAGGTLDNKTNLYKAFYYAHLHFTQGTGEFLSAWPIVRMPRGPGIHNGGILLGELVASKHLRISQIRSGTHAAFRFCLTEKGRRAAAELTSEECEAISKAVAGVFGKTAGRVSDESHVVSKTWHDTENGKELAIYADLLTPDEYAATRARTKKAAEFFRRRHD